MSLLLLLVVAGSGVEPESALGGYESLLDDVAGSGVEPVTSGL